MKTLNQLFNTSFLNINSENCYLVSESPKGTLNIIAPNWKLPVKISKNLFYNYKGQELKTTIKKTHIQIEE